jgi:uncharacterized membrane protein YphA (DoxX/SURF4 family)
MRIFSDTRQLAIWLLQGGLALLFVYAAISSFTNPQNWIGYLPGMLTDRFDAELILHGFSIYELLLAVWLLSGVYTRYAALLCAATLAGIVASNLSLFEIIFRDLALLFAALALAALSSEQGEPKPASD